MWQRVRGITGRSSRVQNRRMRRASRLRRGLTLDDCRKFREQHVPVLAKAYEALDVLYAPLNVCGRLKTAESLHEKMTGRWRGVKLAEATDVVGCRVTLDSLDELHAAVEKLKKSQKVTEISDYITQPKGDIRYRSIHCTIEVEGRPVEVQFRTPHQTRWADWSHETLYKDHSGKKIPDQAWDYAREMSDYYAAVDSGKKDATPPECTEPIRTTVGCLE